MRLYSAISYPRCTISSLEKNETDCGSLGWSYTLFIAWNILSMVCSFSRSTPMIRFLKSSYYQYIFVNMFTGEPHYPRGATWEGNLTAHRCCR